MEVYENSFFEFLSTLKADTLQKQNYLPTKSTWGDIKFEANQKKKKSHFLRNLYLKVLFSFSDSSAFLEAFPKN